MLLADLHIHSTFSDGKFTVPEIVDLYGSADFDVIAITDHLVETHNTLGKFSIKLGLSVTEGNFSDYIETLYEQKERALKKYGMILLPGFELTKNAVRPTHAAHIVALGVDKYISANKDPLSLVREVKEAGGLSVAAHPYMTNRLEFPTMNLWLKRSELAQEIDAWEVGNGCFFFNKVMNAGLPVVASSDFHYREQFTSWKTLIHSRRNQADILEAIRRQNLDVIFYKEHENKTQNRTPVGVYSYDYHGFKPALI